MTIYNIVTYFLIGATVVKSDAIRGRLLCIQGDDCTKCGCGTGRICDTFADIPYCKKLSVPTVPEKVKFKGCFPGSSTIHLSGGMTKRLDQVGVGDFVASLDDDGNFEYSPVIYVPHLKNDQRSDFLKIHCQEKDNTFIRATDDHVLFVSKFKNNTFGEASAVPARDVEIGSWLYSVLPLGDNDNGNGNAVITNKCQVSKIETIVDDSGVYTVFTKNGRFAVDGVVASSYIGGQWILGEDHVGAHKLTSVHRLVYKLGGAESFLFRHINDFIVSYMVTPLFK